MESASVRKKPLLLSKIEVEPELSAYVHKTRKTLDSSLSY